jgi:hypothetical protein
MPQARIVCGCQGIEHIDAVGDVIELSGLAGTGVENAIDLLGKLRSWRAKSPLEEIQRHVDRRLVCGVLWDLDGRAKGRSCEPCRSASAQEIVVADGGQHLQLGVRNGFGGDQAVRVGQGQRIGGAVNDGDRDLDPREAFRRQQLDEGRRNGEGGADA